VFRNDAQAAVSVLLSFKYNFYLIQEETLHEPVLDLRIDFLWEEDMT